VPQARQYVGIPAAVAGSHSRTRHVGFVVDESGNTSLKIVMPRGKVGLVLNEL
jgi:hypothetical protein